MKLNSVKMDKNRKQLEERAAWALCIIVTVIVFGATNIAYLGWRFENFWSKTVWLSVAGVITLAGIAAIIKIIERLNRK